MSTTDPLAPLLTLAEVIGLLRSGASPGAAWAGAGITSDPVTGEPDWDADDATDSAVRAACLLAHRAGAPLADVLDVVSQCLLRQREAGAAREAAIAGPRLSATVLSWLPGVGLGLGALIDTHALHILFRTPLGWLLLVMAALLTGVGRRWMAYLMADAEAAGGGGAGSEHSASIEVVMALMDAAVASGLDVRSALQAIGVAVGGGDGQALDSVAAALAMGQPWDSAWDRMPEHLLPLARALRPAWTAGAAPRSMLTAGARALELRSRMASERAVGELSVRMALPLTFCLLPAFALVGLLPMVIAVASQASLTL